MEEDDINAIRQDNKTRKQEIERKRRLRITNALEELKQFIQETTNIDMRKADKVEILESTLKLIREKKRIHYSDSFRTGYNTCLVELSGKLMTSKDIDYQTKATLLSTISKLTNHNQLPTQAALSPPLQVQSKRIDSGKKVPQQQQQQQQQQQIPVIQNKITNNNNNNTGSAMSSCLNKLPLEKEDRSAQKQSSTTQDQQSNPHTPLVNIGNTTKRGRKRSIDRSNSDLVKRRRSNIENNFQTHQNKESNNCWNVQVQSSTNSTTNNHKNTSAVNNEHQEQNVQFQINSKDKEKLLNGQILNDHHIDSKAQIAIIRKNEQGELIEISRIPLTALLGNIIHQSILKPKPTNDSGQLLSSKPSNKLENLPKATKNPLIDTSSVKSIQGLPENVSHPKGQTSNNQAFSYLELLQDNCDIDQILLNNQGKFETAPLNVSPRNAASFPPLNVFLGQY